ncbi:MAG: radical SAM protein [Candidatus Micrarchaeota archaeon]|nr:radical SAM protein [Candidatus Micrarchaeota archaeon]
MKVMITYPPLSGKGFPLLSQNRQFQWFNNPTLLYPLIPASAATLIDKRGYEVIWKDAIAERVEWDEYVQFIKNKKPGIVAIETKTPVIKHHWKIIDELKKASPGTKFVIMGDHVTAFPEESLKKSEGLDYVITGGDFDFSLLGICDFLSGKEKKLPAGVWYRENDKIKNTGKFQLNHNLNDLPLIDRELTKGYLYNVEYNIKVRPFAYTMAGRDCPYHKCTFCAWPVLFPLFRTRSPESLLDEIGMLIDKYGVKEVFDDTGTFPPGEWLRRFCNGMIERGYNKKVKISCNMRADYINEKDAKLMHKAGFRLLKMGLESGNQKTLDRINKGITVEQIIKSCEIAKKAGLEVHLTMIVGYPWETKKDAMKTFELAKFLMTTGRADVLQSTVLVPYPGTPLWEEGLKNNWFRFDPYDYERYDMKEPVFKTPGMTPEEVMGICTMIYKIFIKPRYVLKRVMGIRSLEDVKYLLRGAKAVIGHMKDFSKNDAKKKR